VMNVLSRHAKAPVSEFGAPSGARNFQEMALGFTTDIAKNNLGESFYRPWVPFVTTIFLFIFVSNWTGGEVPCSAKKRLRMGQIWLCLVLEAVERTAVQRPGFKPDYLVAHLGTDDRAPVFMAPLSRGAGVLLIRELLQRCYAAVDPSERPDLSFIGVHSAKVTLLSIAKHLLLDESLRREQGHHRPMPGQAMSRLYGRDD
ncbi:atpB, partial [Symbiodinium sp. CCMP2456]